MIIVTYVIIYNITLILQIVMLA